MTFEFNSAWDGLTRTVVFRAGSLTLNDMNVDTTSVLPWELTANEVDVYIGVYGTNADGSVVIPTTWAYVGTVLPGAVPSGDKGASPHLPIWLKLQEKMKELEKEALTKDDTPNLIQTILAEITESDWSAAFRPKLMTAEEYDAVTDWDAVLSEGEIAWRCGE